MLRNLNRLEKLLEIVRDSVSQPATLIQSNIFLTDLKHRPRRTNHSTLSTHCAMGKAGKATRLECGQLLPHFVAYAHFLDNKNKQTVLSHGDGHPVGGEHFKMFTITKMRTLCCEVSGERLELKHDEGLMTDDVFHLRHNHKFTRIPPDRDEKLLRSNIYHI